MIESLDRIPQLKRVNLLVTKYCNLHCRMCDYKKRVTLNKRKDSSLSQIQSFIRELARSRSEVL